VLTITGIGVSPGVAWGPGALLRQRQPAVRYAVAPGRAAMESARLEAAREAAVRQLRAILARVTASAVAEFAHLFEAQILMLDDPLLVPRAMRIIEHERINAEWALDRAFDEFSAVFAGVEDAYLRERRGDVADVVGRLRRNLLSAHADAASFLPDLAAPAILVAADLAPSFAAQIDRRLIRGLALEGGSRTHHTAILARSLGLPAVAAAAGVTRYVQPGTVLLVDGDRGEVVIDPSPEVLDAAGARAERRLSRAVRTRAGERGPAVTTDGVAIRFLANVERPAEVEDARSAGAEGIGLFRSEFLLGGRAVGAYDEDAQYRVYRDLVERMAPFPVTIRTFDVDELQASGEDVGGENDRYRDREGSPSRGPLGLRAIRLSLLDERPAFDTQLRALARAACGGSLRVLLPLVSGVEELREARTALEAAVRDTCGAAERRAPVPVGAMIEVPSAALIADLLAADADFFSIGTNDLIQYTLAVDRTDGRVARMFDPLHPAVLRIIRQVIRLARRRRRGVALCGEMAADPSALLLLVGLGVTEFSMSPLAIPEARHLVRRLAMADARRAASRAVGLATSRDIAAMLAGAFPSFVPRPAGSNGGPSEESEP